MGEEGRGWESETEGQRERGAPFTVGEPNPLSPYLLPCARPLLRPCLSLSLSLLYLPHLLRPCSFSLSLSSDVHVVPAALCVAGRLLSLARRRMARGALYAFLWVVWWVAPMRLVSDW